jgi:ankyrin repeat protein
MHGTQVALELMSALDNEAHSPLDWAADSGDVNVIEFFIRKGLNPYRADNLNRTPLYWAVKANRVEAARFLVLCGCDPLMVDTLNQSPMSIAKSNGFEEMVSVLSIEAPLVVNMGEASKSIQCLDPSKMPILSTKSGSQVRSHAIYQHNVSNGATAVGYFMLVIILWLSTVFLPFYVCGFIFVSLYYIYR